MWTGQTAVTAAAGHAAGTVAEIGCEREPRVRPGNFWQSADCCFVHFQLFDDHELQ